MAQVISWRTSATLCEPNFLVQVPSPPPLRNSHPSTTFASVQTLALLLPEWGEQARLFTNSKGEPNFVTTAAVAADMKVWLTDSDHGEFEVPTMVRVKAALDELYCEQLRYGTSLMPRARA